MRKIIGLLFFCNMLSAQLPETDIWLFKIKTEKQILKIVEGKNITSRKGYDNQPCFTPDDKTILYVGVYDGKQSDVYAYNLSKQMSTQLTQTKESEYSPQYTPDNTHFSCVTVEADSSQHFWIYNLDGARNKCFNESIDSIGYYTWLSKDTLLYYKLTSPHSLLRFDNNTKEDKWICNSPSRAFKKIDGNSFIYAIKDSTQIRYRVYHTLIKRSDEFAIHKSTAEDFIWHKDLGLLKSEGALILRYDQKTGSWPTLFDLAPLGIKKITRFAFDSKTKYLAVVDNP